MNKNQELIKIFREIGLYLEMKDIPFKPRAYERVVHSLEGLTEDIEEIYQRGGKSALMEIPGVGESIAEKIIEFLETGKVKEHQELKKEIPVDIESLTAIEGVGPKMVAKLFKTLKITNIEELEKAAKEGKIKKLPGFGEKTEKNILEGIKFLKESGRRFVLGFIEPIVREIESLLADLPEIDQLAIAGSFRRRKETIGDLDILATSKKPKKVMEYFVRLPGVIKIYAQGETKSSIKLENGLDVDLRIVKKESFGSALMYFTGSKDHNVALRELALKKGYKLNEYGLFKGDRKIAGETEEEIYEKLNLQWIPPEMRENQGEIELAMEKKLPKIINYNAIQGDLQIQTDWTDGSNSIEEYVKFALKIGLKYLAITDHTKSLAMTGGLDETKLLQQKAEIDRLNRKYKGKIKIFQGAEVNILKDGSLDIKDEVLEKIDFVGAAVHSHFNLPKSQQTKRIIQAMKNPNVDVIFHPTGRIINRRPAYQLDMKEIFKTAKQTKTLLEIDAYPDRLDLKDEYIRQAIELGVKLVINSDAHSIFHLQFLNYGIAQARRGWAKKSDIINTLSLEKFENLIKKKKQNRPF